MSIKLNAGLRTDQGKGASRRLKRAGSVPAIIYGAGKDPINLTISLNTITKLLEDDTTYTSIIELDIDGKKDEGIIKDLQRHPAKNIVTHIDFQRIDAKVAIVARIPLNFVGASSNKDIRLGAVVNQFINTVEVSCLPKDLPHSIEVDIASVAIGESLRLTDLVITKGVSIVALNHDDVESYNQTVVSISIARKMAEIEEEEVVAPEGDSEEESKEGDK